ncbi:hypothetical protein [Candidatus Chloroploca asiatica]|uniref:hypothetical protein n=1 Tax=Candidatus Chloroploca asiatica TaxID=1506545 RepID=UPI0011448535|nr:hypothetical protein [Candidatus Chloroploca asiatica]
MARSTASGTISERASRGAALTVPRVGDLRPYILLIVLTIVLLMLAYTARPTVVIDLGSTRDMAFLQDFNGREIDASGASEQFAWPAGERELAIPGRRDGVWIATFEASPDQPDRALRQVAIAVDGIRVEMPRLSERTLVAKLTPDLLEAETVTIQTVSPLVGDPEPPTDLVGTLTIAPARTYRWSQGESQIVMPGLGRGAWTAHIRLIAAHPNQQPVEAKLLVNGVPMVAIPDRGEERMIHLHIPGSLMGNGDLELALQANVYNDPRELGVLISRVVVAPAAGTGVIRSAVPPWATTFYMLTMVLGVYGALSMLRVGETTRVMARASLHRWGDLVPLIGALLALLVGAWALAFYRFPTSFFLPRLAGLAIWSIVLALALIPLTNWFFAAIGAIETREHEERGRFTPAPLTSALLLIFFVSYWFKAGGMLYPYFVAVDVQWHMERARWILEGQLPLLYGLNSPLNESTMPTAEWGENRPIIPYSPYFHIFAAPLGLLPWPMPLSINMLSALADSTRIIMIGLLGWRFGLSARNVVFAAAMYAVMPVAFLLHAWGNVPTTFGLWMTLMATTFLVCAWERIHERGPMVIFSLMLTVTFLIYTVTAVFMGVFLVLLTLMLLAAAPKGVEWAALRTRIKPIWQASGVAILVVIVVYYGQYILPIIERSVPYFATVFTQGASSVGVERAPFHLYMWSFFQAFDYRIWPGRYLFYGLAFPLLFTIPGFLHLWKRPLAGVFLAAWFSVSVVFMLAGYRISMVDKQLFYILPIIAICWAVYAGRYWQRGRWAQIMIVMIYLVSAVAALDQWFFRIAISPLS